MASRFNQEAAELTAAWICRRLQELDLLQRHLARRSGLEQSRLSVLMNAKSNPTELEAIWLREHLGGDSYPWEELTQVAKEFFDGQARGDKGPYLSIIPGQEALFEEEEDYALQSAAL